MAEKVVPQVVFEIGQVDHLLETYADLLKHCQRHVPGLVEMTAVASVLHSFYNGLESIFLSIARELDQNVPTGAQWHRDLLLQMTQERTDRGSAISTGLAKELADYLGFRHFYRHSYSFFLEWGELERLVVPLGDVWTRAKTELYDFLDHVAERRRRREPGAS